MKFSLSLTVLALFAGAFMSSDSSAKIPEHQGPCSLKTKLSFLPPKASSIDTEEKFIAAIEEPIELYKEVAAHYGKKVIVEYHWSSNTSMAWTLQSKTKWTLHFYGGLAKTTGLEKDGLQLVACHEIGHHLGGYPFAETYKWASSEGQSDYFATHACLKKVWKDQLEENAKAEASVHSYVKNKCDKIYPKIEDRHLCYRVGNAIDNMRYFEAQDGNPMPEMDTPDLSVIENTELDRIPGQCSIDNMLAGNLCDMEYAEYEIPGLGHPEGKNSRASEEISQKYVCSRSYGFEEGVRPRCWFKPQTIN